MTRTQRPAACGDFSGDADAGAEQAPTAVGKQIHQAHDFSPLYRVHNNTLTALCKVHHGSLALGNMGALVISVATRVEESVHHGVWSAWQECVVSPTTTLHQMKVQKKKSTRREKVGCK